jgi:hypothetical protein
MGGRLRLLRSKGSQGLRLARACDVESEIKVCEKFRRRQCEIGQERGIFWKNELFGSKAFHE